MTEHDHHHHHDDHSELSETELRVRALETILTEKGYVDPAALDAIIQAYETKIGPHNGARVVAKAWSDPAFKQALLEDASKAVGTLGHVSRVGDHLVAVENTRGKIGKKSMIHNDATPKIEIDPETYDVRADGELLVCEPSEQLSMAQKYFLF